MPSACEDYIYLKNLIPVELCKSLIAECNKYEWKKHYWIPVEYGIENDIMSSTKEQQDKITPYLVKALDEYQIKCSWPGDGTQPPWLSEISPIRFDKYEVGNIQRIHYDNIHTIFDGKRKGIPIVSIVGNLNEDYEGAEFMLRGQEIKLKTGDILLFPSGIVYPHMVKETKKGVRYSFVSWAF